MDKSTGSSKGAAASATSATAAHQPTAMSGPGMPLTTGRRIVSEHSKWNLATVPPLTSLCLKALVQNFEKCPVLEGLPLKYKEYILASISTNLPLPTTASLITDEGYWKRRAQAHFKLCDPENHGGSWKQLYFELHVQALLEARYPKRVEAAEETAALEAELQLASPYVRKVHLRQLRPAYDPAITTPSGPERRVELKDVVVCPTDLNPDHLDPGLLFRNLKHLTDLILFYGINDAGTAFHRAFFGMTLRDGMRLASCLSQLNALESLSIRSSGVDDERCLLLAHALLEHRTLTRLDLSHNYIGNKGTRGLAKMLARPECPLTTLVLHNNAIGQEGAASLGKALVHNAHLRHLDLGLNSLQDAGGVELLELLERNSALEEVCLSGNGLGAESVIALCSLLQRNGPALRRFDVSCNKLGAPNSAQVIHDVGTSPDTAATAPAATAPAPVPTPEAAPTPDAAVAAAPVTAEGSDAPAGAAGVTDEPGAILFDAVNRNKYVTKFDIRMTGISAEYTAAIQSIVVENSQ